MELLDTQHKCICFQLRSFMEQFSRESRPHCTSNIKWILVSSSEIKETSIRSFRQDKENYGDHFIIHYYISITLLCPFMQEECAQKYFACIVSINTPIVYRSFLYQWYRLYVIDPATR